MKRDKITGANEASRHLALCGSPNRTVLCDQRGGVAVPAGTARAMRSVAEEIDMQRKTDGWGCGLVGVIIFSGSLPATRIAVGGFTPMFLTSARA